MLWGSGLGADPSRDTTFSTAGLSSGTNGLGAIYIGGSGLVAAAGVGTTNTGNITVTYNVAPPPAGDSAQLSVTAVTKFSSCTGHISYDGLLSAGCNIAEYYYTDPAAPPPAGTSVALATGGITIGSLNPGTAPFSLASTSTTLPAGFVTQSGGTFPITATAGQQVGAFQTQVVFPNPILNWTNQTAASSVTRSAGLTITWTGSELSNMVVAPSGVRAARDD